MGIHVFRHRLRPIPNPTACTSSPGAREPISVVIPFDHPRQKGALKQKGNVGPGKSMMVTMARRRELPGVRRSSLLHRVRFGRGTVLTAMERKKVMEKGKRSEEMD
jgi:hypothetical protein